MSVSVKRTQEFLLALMALAAGLARAGEVQLSGQVTVDGRKPEAPVTLLVTAVQDAELDEQYAGEVVTDDQGRFSAQVSADRGAQIVVKARTPGVPAGEETMVLAGQGEAVAGASDKIDLNVALARVRGNVLKFEVCDQRGIPASRIKVSSQVYRSAGANRVTVDSEIVETATDQDGRFALIVTPGDTRDRKIEIASAGVGGSTYRGVVRLAGKDLPAAYGKELKIQVTREDLAVVVSIKWDPEVSDKPFDPRANRFPGQTLLVEGLPNTERSVDEKGEVRLYEVPPGARVLALGVNTRLRYRMTRGTEKLVVPERTQWPLRHVVTIAPVQFVEARYVFSDSRTGKAVAGVRVRGSLGQAVSDDLGRAVLKCLPGEEVFISGDACSAVRLGAPRKSEVNATKVSLRLYPTVSGKITEQVTKKPVTLTTVELRGQARWDVRGDEFGRFALKVPPGEYTLIVKCKVLTEDLAQQAHKPLPSVLLYEGPIKVADEDVKSDIEVPAVCVLTLEVEGPAAKPDQVPSHVVLLKDGTMQGTAYGNLEDGKCKVYAAQGKYRVLVACSEVLGYLGEQVDLTKAEQSMTVKVSGWTAMKCSPGRQFQMNPEESAPRGKEGQQNSD